MANEKSPLEKLGTSLKPGACYMCDSYCPIKVHVVNGKAKKIEMLNEQAREFCPRWKAQLDFVYHPERILHPLKRVGERGTGEFKEISWSEALDTVAKKLLEIKKESGPEETVFYVAYTKEPRPYLRRLVHAYGSPNYTTETSSCFSATWLAATLNFGKDYGNFLVNSRQIDPECKCMMIWGSAVRHSTPLNWKNCLDAKERRLKYIVVDPRKTQIAGIADIHLQLRPGTDGALALGMMNIIINENLYDKEFVNKWTVGFDKLRELVQDYPPKKVEKITWVPAEKIREAALMFAKNTPSKIMTSPEATVHHQNGVQNTRAIYLIPAILGNIEVPGGNRSSPEKPPTKQITLQEKVKDMPQGVGAQRFPVFTELFEEMQANAIVEQILTSKPYPIRALVAAGLNLQFFPNSRRLEDTLKQLELIVDIDFFHTPATRISDIVLPISTWLERDILLTREGGHVWLIEPSIEPVGESWPEWKIYYELAKRLGLDDEYWNGDIEKCFNEILEPIGLTVKKLRKTPDGIMYPMPAKSIKQYEATGFKTPSGKVEIESSILRKHGYEPLPIYREPAESPISTPKLAEKYPLVLTTGARTVNFTNSQYRNIKKLREMVPEPLLEIHPDDAEKRKIEQRQRVMVSSSRGSVIVKANITDTTLPGVVHLPHLWPDELNVNLLCDDKNLDPISGFPAYKSQLCQVTPI
ncbi:MAG: molybdopterin-dependent oxidoreductase [Candidatus Bathyarchaeia archaeon]|jgi:anaerobic selenocysteine-containing dehydrogenase